MAKTKITITAVKINNQKGTTAVPSQSAESEVVDGILVADHHATNPGVQNDTSK